MTFRKPLFVLFFLLSPLPTLAAEVLMESGLKIQIPDAEINYYVESGHLWRFPTGIYWWAKALVEVPHAQADELTELEKIKLYIYLMADKYEVNGDQLIALARCESNFDMNAHNPTDPHGGAWGIYQYLRPTFNRWQKESGIKGKFMDSQTQTELTAWAWSKGYQMAWRNCYIYTTKGYWPK